MTHHARPNWLAGAMILTLAGAAIGRSEWSSRVTRTPGLHGDESGAMFVESESTASAVRALRPDSIGSSRDGRPLELIRVAEGDAATFDSRPALLIVAGLNPQHRVGIDVARGVAAKLAAEKNEVLASTVVYIIPSANPDGVVRELATKLKRESGRTLAPHDDDGDRRIDEDGPVDLNGDGYITMMRVPDPPPGYGLEATEMIESADSRLTRRPDRLKGERATHAILIEGADQDGDGKIAEDGTDRVDMNMNFPYHWPEFREGAGTYPLSEPETRSLAEFVLNHPNIVAVLVYGPHDNLVKTPEAGRMDQTGRVPDNNIVENDDKQYYEQVGKLFKDATGMTGAPTGDPAGSFHGWTYGFQGIWSFSTPVWVRPDLVKQEEKKEEKKDGEKKDDAPAGDAKLGEPAAVPPGGAPGALSDAEIQARITEFKNATPEKRREMMQLALTLPAETQEKLRAAAMAAFAGGAPEVAPAPSPAAAVTGAQPAGGGGPGRGRGRGGRGGEGAGEQPAGGGGQRPAPDGDDAKWLKYSDEQRNKEGFIDYAPFDHPQLGTVEIGGFVPGFKWNPPEGEVEKLVDQQTRFVTDLLSKFPRLQIDDPVVQEMGAGVWRITVRVSNEGFMPTRSAMGVKTRRLPPIRIQLDLPEESVVSGDRMVRVQSLPGAGGSRTAEWVVAAKEGASAAVWVKAPEFGDRKIDVTLKAQPRKQKVPAPPADEAKPANEKPAGGAEGDAKPPGTIGLVDPNRDRQGALRSLVSLHHSLTLAARMFTPDLDCTMSDRSTEVRS